MGLLSEKGMNSKTKVLNLKKQRECVTGTVGLHAELNKKMTEEK